MKKFFLTALIIAGAGFGLLSCNNGAYDADPDNDYSHVPNPLDPKNHPGNLLGTFTCKINGNVVNYLGGAKDSANWLVVLGAKTPDLAHPFDADMMSFYFDNFLGVRSYSHTDSTDSVSVQFMQIRDTFQQTYFEVYPHLGGHFQVNIIENANNKIRGTFEGILYKVAFPDPDTTNKMVITEGKFHIEKS